MATANNTIKTRIQLKSDTEANWNKAGPKEGSNGFVPLLGELIVYLPDATHPFSRLKVGNGTTNVVNLPFIDADTIDGHDVEIVTRANLLAFPAVGSPDKLYIDQSNQIVYHYIAGVGYKKLSNFNYTPTKAQVSDIAFWGAGSMSNATVSNNTLHLTIGVAPQLLVGKTTVVTDISKEGTV